MFSPVTIDVESLSYPAIGLGPMAVVPSLQGRGIGSRLVDNGIRECRHLGNEIIVVLGYPDYYSRFGFTPASQYGLRRQWEGIPDEAFMITVFDRDALSGAHGVARYRDEFNEAM